MIFFKIQTIIYVMACLTPAKKADYQARLTKLLALQTAMDNAIDEGITNSNISNYEFDSGEGKQKTTYRNVNELFKSYDAIQLRIDWLRNALAGRGVVNLGLKRY